MKLTFDTSNQNVIVDGCAGPITYPLYSREAFELLSDLWVRVGWNQKYTYSFTWMGRPVIQLPEDLIRIQEVIYRIRPDVIVETGIAHGGSLVFYAGLCKLIGKGRVIGIDIDIRPHNRQAIEGHELREFLTVVEGSSIAPEVVQQVRSHIREGESGLVILDSNHTTRHVAAELEAYAPFVGLNSYIVVTDGIMKDLYDVPRGQPEWIADNPARAAHDFLQCHPDFVLDRPPWPFRETDLAQPVTHWPDAWLRRIAPHATGGAV